MAYVAHVQRAVTDLLALISFTPANLRFSLKALDNIHVRIHVIIRYLIVAYFQDAPVIRAKFLLYSYSSVTSEITFPGSDIELCYTVRYNIGSFAPSLTMPYPHIGCNVLPKAFMPLKVSITASSALMPS